MNYKKAISNDPCVSAVALITLTVKLNEYPFPESTPEQEKLLDKLTNFIQMIWDETLDLEMGEIIDQCSKSDTDFEFVIDQSGSGWVTRQLPVVNRGWISVNSQLSDLIMS